MQIIELRYYIDLLPHCNIFCENDMVEIFFHDIETKPYYIAREFSNLADESFIAENAFKEDNTVNHVVKFKKSRMEDIAFMQYIFSKSNNKISGYAIKKIELLDFYLGLEIDPPNRPYGLYRNLTEQNKLYHRNLLKQLYLWLGEDVNYWKVPNNTPNKTKISTMQSIAITDFLNKNYIPYKLKEEKNEYGKLKFFDVDSVMIARKKDNEKFYEMLSSFKRRYDEIYDYLVESGLNRPIWKSEYEMYKLVKSFFKDTVYQYRADWLKHQTLDVYIPSKKIGIEYQGEQHYKAIERFGGEESFIKTKERDIKKKSLCKKNNVILIEWKYNEPINEITLKRKLNTT